MATGNNLLLRVGGGRGFVVEEKRGLCFHPKRMVVTAAHCLPVVPRAPGFRGNWDETLPDLLGPADQVASSLRRPQISIHQGAKLLARALRRG